jgi:hypothetical protein
VHSDASPGEALHVGHRRDVVGDSGDAPGICTDYALNRDLKDSHTVVVLSNTSTVGHAVGKTIVSLYQSVPTQQ